ncbi:MAG TPA: TonB-dependent receptor, partial [Gammaproteobacteria bacterium]
MIATIGAFGFTPSAWPQAVELDGLMVLDALTQLEAEGLELVYSTDLVQPWMRVREPRSEADPAQALLNLLAPYGLTTREGPGSSLLIVRTEEPVDLPPETGSLFGVVNDDDRPIAGAIVTIREAARSTSTDSQGRFLFTDLDLGNYSVLVTHPVFAPATAETVGIEARQTSMITFALEVAPPAALEEIVVAASQYQLTRTVSSTHTLLTSEDIEYLPDFGDDALRAVGRLPGTTTNGVSARSNVRGGEVGETLVRFDSLRLYEPFHLKEFQSIFSTVDPRVISSMDIYTGGFPAAFGDRMSSVVDVVSLSSPDAPFTEVALSFFNSSVLNAGTFEDGKGEWVGSIRRSNLDVLYDAFSNQAGQPRYVDAFGKLSYAISDSLRITGNYLFFADDTLLRDVDLSRGASAEGEDRYLWLRLDHTPRAGLSGATLVSQSKFTDDRSGFTDEPGVSVGTLEDHRSFSIHSIQSDWTWSPNQSLFLQFGGTLSRAEGRYLYQDDVEFDLLFDVPGATTATQRSRDIRISPSGEQYAAYASLRYSPNAEFAADFGLRWDKQTLDAERTDTLGPRLGFRYRLAERTYLRGSWGRFYQSQGINELQVNDGVAEFFRPQRSDHTVVGIEHNFSNGLNLRIEAYDKRMRSLRPRYENLLNTLILLPELKPDRVRIAPSEARARGLEFMLNQQLSEPMTWWFGYSRAW